MTDNRLGRDRGISRRDFMDGSLKLATGIGLGATLPRASTASAASNSSGHYYYPPTQSGLRGSHRGAFEVAHQLGLEGRQSWGDPGVGGICTWSAWL